MNVSIISITPERAKSLLALRWERQRKIRTDHVTFLASEMKKGRFDPATIELVKISGNGQTVMIDGQHALTAITVSGKSQKMILKESIVKQESEVPVIFSRIDVQRKRNLGDSLYAFDMKGKMSMTASYLQRLSSAIRFVEDDFGVLYKTRVGKAIEDKISDILYWEDQAYEFYKIYQSIPGDDREKAKFLNRTVFSVAIVLLRYVENKEKVRWFLTGLVHGNDLSVRDPRLIARKKLLSGIGTSRFSYERWHPNALARIVAWAWNAYYLGETRNRITIRNKNLAKPIELKGTKYYTGRKTLVD